MFLALWQAAWQAENNITAPRVSASETAAPNSAGAAGAGGAGLAGWARPGTTGSYQRIWSNEIPARNLNFTGREAELERCATTSASAGRPPAQVISGMGGIGKTELATEYIHRNIDTYEIIWWIRAEHQDRVRDALVNLGQRLELGQATTDSARDRTVAAVLETLQSGDPAELAACIR